MLTKYILDLASSGIKKFFDLIQMRLSVVGSMKPEPFTDLPKVPDQILARLFQFEINRLGGGKGKLCGRPGRNG